MRYLFFIVLLFCVLPVSTQTLHIPLTPVRVDSLLTDIHRIYDQAYRDEAIAELTSLKQKIKEQLGGQSVSFSSACFLEGVLLSNSGHRVNAEKAFQESIEIRESISDTRSDAYLECLSRLAIVQTDMGKFDRAAESVQRLKRIRESTLPSNDPRFISCIRELGWLYRQMGTYELADSIFQVYTQRQPDGGPQTMIEYARLLGEQADLYREMEDFERAVPTYLKALPLFSTRPSKESGEYIKLLTGLANLYLEMGQLEESQNYLNKAKKQVQTGFLFFKKVKYGPVLLSLGDLYRATNDFDAAEELYLDGMDELEGELLQGYPDYARLQSELASLYHEQGNKDLVEETYLKAIRLWEQLPGARVPWYPQTMMGLAKLYQEQDWLSESTALFLQSKQYWEKTLGNQYPLYIINILDLARLSWETGHYSQADSLYGMAADLGRERLIGASQYMSARELNKYMQKIIDTQAEILSFVNQSPIHSITAESCYNNALFYKGFLLQNAIQIRRAASANAGSAAVFLQLNANRRLLSREMSKPISERDTVIHFQYRIDSLERELICMVSEVATLTRQTVWQDVAAVLDSNEAAIEFIHYRYYQPAITDSMMYAALVIKSGYSKPQVIPLFKCHMDDPIIHAGHMDNVNYINSLYSLDTRGLVRVDQVRPNLHELIWEPIKEAGLSGIDRIYCSLSEIFHRINLGAIQVNNDHLISDEFEVVRVGSTREVGRFKTNQRDSSSHVVIFGGIDYNAMTVDTSVHTSDLVMHSSQADWGQDRGDLDGTWTYLVGTQKEANTLTDICDSLHIFSQTYTDSHATEDVIKWHGESGYPPSPWLLHLGTHGFFFPDPEEEVSDHLLERKVIFKTSNQPMLRSGLVLAGANYFWQNNQLLAGATEDGILTAEEISYLDLSNTELAVLSACETGLGDIQGNEGVFGLQRAFKIAGTRNLIMSLWKIPDKESQLFMDSFYRFWLVEGHTIRDAFRLAQRERRIYSSHYSWAGFILLSH